MNMLHGAVVGFKDSILVLGAEMSLECSVEGFRRQEVQKLLEVVYI